MQGHGSGVLALRFSPDAKTVVTSGHDQTVRFWHVPTEREMLLLSQARTQDFASRARLLSPTGELLVVWDEARQAVRVDQIPTLAEIEAADAKAKTETRRQ